MKYDVRRDPEGLADAIRSNPQIKAVAQNRSLRDNPTELGTEEWDSLWSTLQSMNGRSPGHKEMLAFIHKIQEVYALPEFQALMHEEWVNKMQQLYMQGLAVKVSPESLHQLMTYEKARETDDFSKESLRDLMQWEGTLVTKTAEDRWSDRKDGRSAQVLNAELRLKPEQYRYLHPGRNDAEMTVDINRDTLPMLHVEGRPFPTVMDTVKRTGCSSDDDLKKLLNLQNLKDMTTGGRKIPSEYQLPECLKPMMKDINEWFNNEYESYVFVSSSIGFQPIIREKNEKYRHRAEVLLLRCNAMDSEQYNIRAVYKKGELKHKNLEELATLINGRFGRHIFAVPSANTIEVSVNTVQVSKEAHAEVRYLLRKEPFLEGIEEIPFQNLEMKNKVYVLLEDGRFVEGYLNVGSAGCRFKYALATDGKTQCLSDAEELTGMKNWHKLTSTNGHYQFATDQKLKDVSEDRLLPVKAVYQNKDIQKLGHLFNTRIVKEKGANVFSVYAKIDNKEVGPCRMKKGDVDVLRAARRFFNDEDAVKLVKELLVSGYFRKELDEAVQKEQVREAQRTCKEEHEQQLLDRITDASLYGKVNNIHVRCKIDGVQQMGRPVGDGIHENFKGVLVEAAKDLGRDTLNYNNFIHSDNIRMIAKDVFNDVLKNNPSIEQENGRKR